MSRLVRTILLLAVAGSLALPCTAIANPPTPADAHDSAAGAVAEWLDWLWQPIAEWFHSSPPEEQPPPQCAGTDTDQAETDGGPDIDPNG